MLRGHGLSTGQCQAMTRAQHQSTPLPVDSDTSPGAWSWQEAAGHKQVKELPMLGHWGYDRVLGQRGGGSGEQAQGTWRAPSLGEGLGGTGK